jgi:hypothetical protein
MALGECFFSFVEVSLRSMIVSIASTQHRLDTGTVNDTPVIASCELLAWRSGHVPCHLEVLALHWVWLPGNF